jgi:hypothetical protein
MRTLIDPPGGWRYGFPKPYDEDFDGPYEDFLVKNGYPKDEVELALSYSWVTVLEDTDETT